VTAGRGGEPGGTRAAGADRPGRPTEAGRSLPSRLGAPRPAVVGGVLVATWTVLAGAVQLGLTPVSVVLGLPLVLVVPGAFLLSVVRPASSGLERAALTVSLSLAVLTAAVAAASLLPGGISSTTVVATMAVSTALLGGLSAATRRRAPMPSTAPAPRLPRQHSRRRTVVWVATALWVSACVAAAIAVSVVTEQSTYDQPLTQLSLVRQDDGDLQLAVRNLEGTDTSYRMEIDEPGAATSVRELTVAPDEVYRETLRSPDSGEVVVRLYGGTVAEPGYRQVTAVVP
jgi:hypothetical protein